MSSRTQRDWRFFLDDMIEFCEKALTYTADLDQAAFVSNELVYDATLRNMELIGEAATHVPKDAREAHPEVPWRTIIAMRNRLIHGYLGIDDDVLWSIIRDELPAIVPELRTLKRNLGS